MIREVSEPQLRVFEGPFELLLELFNRKRLDLKEVSLFQIIEDYLVYLYRMEELDLDIATEFLSVAVTLLNLKASNVLPQSVFIQEELPLPRSPEELISRLKEYRQVKKASYYLKERIEGERSYSREVEPERFLLQKVKISLPERIEPHVLKSLLCKSLWREEISTDTLHSVAYTFRLEKKISLLRGELKRRGKISFKNILRMIPPRRGAFIALFLAFLELFKNGEVRAYQLEPFGDIIIERNEEKSR
jgi:segregation and condensation protein A